MSLIQIPGDSYRTEIKKGRFYHCPSYIPNDSMIIVRPLYDGSRHDKIDADIIPIEKCPNSFSHSGYSKLKLKSDEEFVLVKVKKRRVVVLTEADNYGLIKVAPVYTVKNYHRERFNMEELQAQNLTGIIYLHESEINKESIIALMESFAIPTRFLQSLRLELNQDGISILDDHIVMMYDIYSDSR